MVTEDYQWLGIALPVDVGPTRVMVTPLAFFDEEADSWHLIDENERKHSFPRDGKVIVFEREWSGCQPNWLYIFRPAVNRFSKLSPEAPMYAQFWIPQPPSPTSLAQILDWTTVAVVSDLPMILSRSEVVKEAHTQRIYIRHSQNLYGPIVLDQPTGRPREYVQSTPVGGPSLIVHVFRLPKESLLQVTVQGAQVVLLDDQSLDVEQGDEDWSMPQVVIKRVLEASNKLPLSADEDAHLVDRRIRELARAASAEGPEALQISPATLLRAQRIIGDQEDVLQTLHNLGATLIGLPALRPHVDAAIAHEVEVRSDELTARLASELQQVALAEADLRATQARQQEISAENERLLTEKTRLERDLVNFEAHMKERIEALRAEPLQTLAELHLASVLLPISAAPQSEIEWNDMKFDRASRPDKYAGDGIGWSEPEQTEILTTPEALRRQWVIAAQRFGVRSQDVRSCAAILLAGRIPVPVGSKATAVLHAVGDVLMGGRVWNVPVPVTALAPIDFYGSIDPATHQFIPAAGALADIVLAAQAHPADLCLVIFEGWDRVPGMPTYVPLLRQYIEVQRHVAGGGTPAPLSLFHPRALKVNSPYAAFAWFSWPPNLLVAGVLDETDGTFTVPSECASWFVRPEISSTVERVANGEDYVRMVAVGSSTWVNWQHHIRHTAADPVTDASEDGNVDTALLATALRFWGTPSESEVTLLAHASEWFGVRGNGHLHMEGRLQ